LRRGSRFNASDLSYRQPSKSASRAGDQTTAVAEVPPRRRRRSTDVASRVALLASIPIDTDTQTSVSRRRHRLNEQTVEVSRRGSGHEVTDSQSPALPMLENHAALVTEHVGHQSVDVEDRCLSVSFDEDVQQSPNTEESRQVYRTELLYQFIGLLRNK